MIDLNVKASHSQMHFIRHHHVQCKFFMSFTLACLVQPSIICELYSIGNKQCNNLEHACVNAPYGLLLQLFFKKLSKGIPKQNIRQLLY